MKRAFAIFIVVVASACAADEFLDRLGEALTWTSLDGGARGHVSGLVDAEGYALPMPAPGVIYADSSLLFNPRVSLFFDGQVGDHLYAFAQARVDRGFDPSPDKIRTRLDEYAIRWNAHSTEAFDVQVGKFGTVVGNWVPRHDSWQNPFITAPLPYENLTGMWDNEPVQSPEQLLVWSHVRPGLPSSFDEQEKYLQLPIVWGPSYATGAAVAGSAGRVRYAFEVKNASLSSRPDAWSPRESRWDHPTVSGRVRFTPSQPWEFGVSASSGSFLRPMAGPLLPSSTGLGQYREEVLAADLSYAWHHFQFWAEAFAARFIVPRVGNPETFSYYFETRYRFSPEFSGAVRWGEQTYNTIATATGAARWGHNIWRFDVAPMWRFTAHAQLKFQYSLLRLDGLVPRTTDMAATQLTVRF